MACTLCDDTGWRPVDEGGTRRVVRCDCWRENIGRQRLSEAHIPKRYQHCSLANFALVALCVPLLVDLRDLRALRA